MRNGLLCVGVCCGFVVSCGSSTGSETPAVAGASSGGASATGGAAASTGSGASSGAVGTSATGGLPGATGGASGAIGGAPAVGGGVAAPSGGSPSAGGGPAGGGSPQPTGGAPAIGGGPGGTQPSGGSSMGGGPGAGGVSTGGSSPSGGSDSTGGNGGSSTGGNGGSPTGGDTATGGSSSDTCPEPNIPAVSSLQNVSEMPDPFEFLDGTRMTSPQEWACRRKELDALVQKYQYGPYPPAPDKVTGSLTGNSLTVKVDYQGNSMSFSCPVTMPGGSGPFPVLIGLSSAPVSVSGKNIATIDFDTNSVAQDGQARRSGAFYELYGSVADNTGSLMAWGWGVHRIVDALEQLDEFDASKVIVNGFSRWGKGAAVAGAFDERIALTIISSSGAGGIGSWRSAQKQSAAGDKVQTLSQLTGEASWMAPDFGTNFGNAVNKLPFDGHEVIALIAPRPVLVTESGDDSWNNPVGGYHSAVAAHKVWEYLGIPEHMGFSSHRNGGHAFGEQQAASAFIDRFILGGSANTTYMENPNDFSIDSSLIPWSVP